VPLDRAAALLEGRVAVVTGAARGIGQAIAEAFARFGADVALCDRDAEGLSASARAVERAGRRSLAGVLDVRDDSAVAGFFDELAGAFPRIDVLVNNAGGTSRHRSSRSARRAATR
jgi:3-oxoacyl-[acyl-carrier protein] reductase